MASSRKDDGSWNYPCHLHASGPQLTDIENEQQVQLMTLMVGRRVDHHREGRPLQRCHRLE